MSGNFAENFDRLLGFHRLSARKASELLGISAPSISYWRNGHREPDRESLMRISLFFGIDPFALLMAPIQDLLPVFADPGRFEWAEGNVERGDHRFERVEGGVRFGSLKGMTDDEVADAWSTLSETTGFAIPSAAQVMGWHPREGVSGDAQKVRRLQPVASQRSDDA